MTTKNSPLSELKAQADAIAMALKASAKFNHKEVYKIGVMMDDKLMTIEFTLASIKETSEEGLSEYIVNQMRESEDTIN